MSSISKKVSPLVKTQLPDFIREDAPLFQKFVEGYYEFLEQGNNVIEVTRSLQSYQDIDTSVDKYIEYIKRELLPSFPKTLTADQKILVKRAKDFYRSRGSEKSYQLLFRALYNEDITIYDPGDSILRASDGRWIQENSIRVGDPVVGNTELLLGQNITGISSGATAKVERITQTFESGFLVKEMFLSNIDGTFEDLELVRNTANSVNATIYNVTGPLLTVEVINKGAGYQLGDNLNLTSDVNLTDAEGIVSETDNFSAIRINLANGGSGYFANTPISVTPNTSSGGIGAGAYVQTIKNTEVLRINTEKINSLRDVPLNVTGGVSNSTTNTAFAALGGNTTALNANLAQANCFSRLVDALTLANVTVGTINSIYQTSYGYNYNPLPSVSAFNRDVASEGISDGVGGIKGENAVFTVEHLPGGVKTVTVGSNKGSGFNKYETLKLLNNDRVPTANATGTAEITGLRSYEGKYIDTKGFLSWNNRLQDNFFYQVYSYVIRSNNMVRQYKQFVDDLVHPAGTKLFGEVSQKSVISQVTVVSSNVSTTSSAVVNFDSTALTFDSANTSFDAI